MSMAKQDNYKISIHALREEGDGLVSLTVTSPKTFLSTPSARRATLELRGRFGAVKISIHALREEGDHPHRSRNSQHPKISIHALREEGDPPHLCEL